MNFSPFGGHFPGSLSTIQQFTAKFGQDNANNTCSTQISAAGRYAGNSVASFNQQTSQNQQLMMSTKYQQNSSFGNQGLYGGELINPGRIDKIQSYNQPHDIAQSLCATVIQNQQEPKNQQINSASQKVKI